MPDYIWYYVCSAELADGEYTFPEGTLKIQNGFADWIPKQA